jgi:hypothetical protein
VVFQRACRSIHGCRDLLWLIGEHGGVQLERWLDQGDGLYRWREDLAVDLADHGSNAQPLPVQTRCVQANCSRTGSSVIRDRALTSTTVTPHQRVEVR